MRGYVKSVFLALEQGRVTWRDAQKIRDIRAEAIEGSTRLQEDDSSSRQSTSQPAAPKPKQTRYCNNFNKGECAFDKQTHQSSRGVVSHICRFCFTKQGKEFHHAEIECNNKVK